MANFFFVFDITPVNQFFPFTRRKLIFITTSQNIRFLLSPYIIVYSKLKSVDNVYNFVYKSLLNDFGQGFLWITFLIFQLTLFSLLIPHLFLYNVHRQPYRSLPPPECNILTTSVIHQTNISDCAVRYIL